jgi:glycosyltransferase involved in cell wall biosynthesis
MACSCPVIVSNAASLPEVCGDAAYYVDPCDVEDIAEGINEVLMNRALRQDLIAKGLERAKLFSWEKAAKEHLKVFEEVLNS